MGVDDMIEPRSSPDEEAPPAGRSRWERPSLTFVGNVQDLVRGETKFSGPANDSDMKDFRKSPGLT